jgi:hypothetical protein
MASNDICVSREGSAYGLQRLNINQDPNVDNIFAEWPFLSEMRYSAIHFKLPTGVELDNFEYYFKKYKGFLLPILEKCNNKEISKVLETTKTNPIEIDARIMKLLVAYFKEDYLSLVVDFPVKKIYNLFDYSMIKLMLFFSVGNHSSSFIGKVGELNICNFN